MKNLGNTPWLNADGTKKTEKEIKELGKTWSSTTWNSYLDSEVGDLQDDRLTFFENMDTQDFSERSEVLKFLQDTKYYEGLETALSIVLDKLSPKERLIIRESFWKKSSDQEIAAKINSTHGSVRNLKHRAIKKIGKMLSSKELKEEVLDFKASKTRKSAKAVA